MNDIQIGTPSGDLIIDRLNNAGYEAYYVGGCVRNYLLGIKIKDYDITTSATPTDVINLFSDNKTFDNGIKHGTVTVIIDQPYEITTFRTEGKYTDSRHPDKVTFCSSLYDDLKRRDFTCNAMAFSKKQGLIDIFGSYYDTRNFILKAVGHPSLRFEEDALRILRGLRLSATYGFVPEQKTAQAMHSSKSLIDKISRERVYAELCQIFEGRYLYKALKDYGDIIAQALQIEITDKLYDISLDAAERCSGGFYVKFSAFLYIILDGNLDLAVEISSKLRCENLLRKHIHVLFDSYAYLCDNLVDFKVHTQLRRYHIKCLLQKTRDFFESFIQFFIAVNSNTDCIEIAKSIQNEALDIIGKNECIRVEDLAITGLELQHIGYEGAMIANTLKAILDKVMKGELQNTPNNLLEYTEKLRQ